MQLRGWGRTRASRIVIILLVAQHLGLGLVQAFVPAPTDGLTLAGRTQTTIALDAVATLAIPFDASPHTSAILGELGSRAIPPDPAPLPRRLPRAPPAA
jgi:hypothetical protein